MSQADRVFIVLLLLFAAALRFSGIDFAMPDPAAYPSHQALDTIHVNTPLQPDEFQFVTMPLRMVLTNSLNPRYYINPPLPTYLTWFHILITGSANGLEHEPRKNLSEREYAPFRFYVVARIHSALLGILAVAATWAATRLTAGRYAAVVAALLVAVSPLLVQYGHYAKNDSPSMGFAALCVWACLMALRNERWRWRLLVIAGVAVGAASASRYNASPVALVLFFTGLLLWYRNQSWATAWRVLLVWLSFPLSFILFIPAIYMAFGQFWEGFIYGYGHYIEGNDATLTGVNGREALIRYLMLYGIGIPAFGLMLLGLLVAWLKRGRDFLRDNSQALDVLLLLAYLVPYVIVVVNPTNVFRSHALLIPALPQFSLLAGIGAAWLAQHLLRNQRILRALFTVAVITIPLAMSVEFVAYMNQADTRDLMRDWIYAHIPQGTSMRVAGAYNVALDESYYELSYTYTENFRLEDLAAQGLDYAVVADAVFVNFALAGGQGGTPAVAAGAEATIQNYLAYPNRVAWIERPSMMGNQDAMFLSAYFHNPGLYVFCLNEAACAAVR